MIKTFMTPIGPQYVNELYNLCLTSCMKISILKFGKKDGRGSRVGRTCMYKDSQYVEDGKPACMSIRSCMGKNMKQTPAFLMTAITVPSDI